MPLCDAIAISVLWVLLVISVAQAREWLTRYRDALGLIRSLNKELLYERRQRTRAEHPLHHAYRYATINELIGAHTVEES